MDLEIKTAAEIMDAELEARWAARRAARRNPVLQLVLRRFIERAGPVRVAEVTEALAPRPPAEVHAELVALDAKDLLLLAGDRVELAYPFSGPPTAFAVELPGGRLRYACCALDALGLAPMLRQPVAIRSECHDCGEPLALGADPDRARPDAPGVMLWIGRQLGDERRICTTL